MGVNYGQKVKPPLFTPKFTKHQKDKLHIEIKESVNSSFIVVSLHPCDAKCHVTKADNSQTGFMSYYPPCYCWVTIFVCSRQF